MSDMTKNETPGVDAPGEVEVPDVVVEADIVDVVEEGEPVAVIDEEPFAADLGLELPEDAGEAQALLLRELAESRAEASEYLGNLQRIAAEFDNYRKRVQRDHMENVLRASQRIVESMLPTLDALDAALTYEAQTPAEEKLLAGMQGTHTQLRDTLAREGLAAIAAAGEQFDPAVHEAVAGGGDGDLVVVEELRRGYTLQGKVLRPALVMVAPSTPEEAS